MSARSFAPLARASRDALKSTSQQSLRRGFSSSVTRNAKYVPTFPQTSNTELNELLAECRQKLFIMGNLPPRLKKVIGRYENKKMLDNEPLVVDIGGEEFKLKYINLKEIPSASRSLTRLLELCKETGKWDILPEFLAGLKSAKTALPASKIEQVIRKAAESGQIGLILECARRAKTTGLTLNSVDRVADLMFYIQYEAFEENWSFEATNTALKRAQQVAEMLESEQHAGGTQGVAKSDPRISPMVSGTLLQLATIQAIKDRGGQDARGLVEKYAQRLTGTIVGTKLADFFPELPGPAESIENSHFIRRIAPVVQGIRLAQTVLPTTSQAATDLVAADASLTKLVESVRQVQTTPSFGKQVFKRYTGTKWDTFVELAPQQAAKKE